MKSNTGNWKEKWKKLPIKSFFFQLSIVVIGIFITFACSDLINKISERNKLRQSMRMIVAELESNQKEMEGIASFAIVENRVSAYITGNLKDFTAIPADTLERYVNLFLETYQFNIQKNAVEAFKISGVAQYESSQELLSEIFTCYENLEKIKWVIDLHYNGKQQRMDHFISKLSLPQIIRMKEEPLYFWTLFLEDNNMRNHSLNRGYTQSILYAHEIIQNDISETIELIREKYKL